MNKELWHQMSVDFIYPLSHYNTGMWHDMQVAGFSLSHAWYEDMMNAALMGGEIDK